MAAPTNISAATAIELGPFPNVLTQDVNDGGTTYTVWYKYTAVAGDNVVGVFARSDDLAVYKPQMSVRSANGVTAYLGGIGGINTPVQFPVTAGTTYTLRITSSSGNVGTAHLIISGLQHIDLEVPVGSIAVSDDSPGFPLALIDAPTGVVLKFEPDFPSGETAEVLPGGFLLLEDATAIAGQSVVKLYDIDRALIATIAVNTANNDFLYIRSNNVDKFYVGMSVDNQHDPTNGNGSIQRIATDGTVEQIWVLDNDDLAGGVGVNPTETIAYYVASSGGATKIKRWDLVNDVALSDVITIAGASPRDMLVLLDGTIVVLTVSASTFGTVRTFNGTGDPILTYEIGDTRDQKLAQAIDNPNSFWVWKKPVTLGPVTPTGVSLFINVKASDGSVLSTITSYIYEEGSYGGVATLTPPADFGQSFSCPFWITREAIVPPEERTTPTMTPPEDCPCPPPDGGPAAVPGLGTPPPTGTGPIGGGGFGKSGTNEGGTGWTPSLCGGGGTVGSYPVADPGESMADVREPRVWVELTFDDAPALWAMDVTLNEAAWGGQKEGRGFGLSRLTRSMSDDNGNYVGTKVTVGVNDKDRAALRTRLGTDAGKYVWEREGVIRIASEANRRSGYATLPRELFRGMTHDVSLEAQFTGSVTLEDKLCSQFGAFGPDRSFSSRLLTLGLVPGCPRDLVGKPQQWIFGEVSDEGATNPAGEPASKGLVPIWLVGSLGSEDEYHLAAHEIGGMILYGSDGGDPETEPPTPPKRILISEYRFETLDLTDSETGLTHRVTHVFLPSDSIPSQDHKNGRLTMAANVCGVYGANGATITDLFSIYQYIFEHIVLPVQESLTGEYVGAPQWADGRYMVHSDSFALAQAYSAVRIGGAGYQGAFVLGGPAAGAVTLRELLRRMSNSGDGWFTWSAAGQLKVVLLDDALSFASAPILDEPAKLRKMPTPTFAFDEVENPVLYSYDYDDDKQRFRVAQESIENATALARMGRPRPSPTPIAMRCVRDSVTARDVASRRLLRREYPPAYYPIVEPIDGLDRDPGDILKVTSQEGVGDGCNERPMWIRDTTFDQKTWRNTHICRDLTDILGSAAFAGPADLPAYGSATTAERTAYVFATDDDGLVTSGVVGKGVR